MSIIHVFARWILGVFAQGADRRRVSAYPAAPVAPHMAEAFCKAAASPSAQVAPHMRHASLDVFGESPVRPYVLQAVREQERLRSRRQRLAAVVMFGTETVAR